MATMGQGLLTRSTAGDQPSLSIDSDGFRVWRFNGWLHRVDGPAVEYPNGDRMWYLKEWRHRADGPAVERADGHHEWFLDDRQMTFSEWLDAAARTEEERVSLIMRWS